MKECIIYKHEGRITNRPVVKKFFDELREGRYLLTAKNLRKRSLPQNAYYWKIVVPMVKDGLYDAGYSEVKTNDDAHEILKHLFLKKKIVNIHTDEVIEIAGSTAKLQAAEFNNFLEEIWQWSAEYLGVEIPAPQSQAKLFIQ